MKKVQLMIIFCLLTLSVACAAGLHDEFRDPPDRAGNVLDGAILLSAFVPDPVW